MYASLSDTHNHKQLFTRPFSFLNSSVSRQVSLGTKIKYKGIHMWGHPAQKDPILACFSFTSLALFSINSMYFVLSSSHGLGPRIFSQLSMSRLSFISWYSSKRFACLSTSHPFAFNCSLVSPSSRWCWDTLYRTSVKIDRPKEAPATRSFKKGIRSNAWQTAIKYLQWMVVLS